METIIKIIISTIASFCSFIFKDFDLPLKLLLICIAIDYISGLIKAFYTKSLSSKQGIKGLLKKVGFLILVAVSVVIDYATNMNGAIRLLVIYYLVANESLSIIENLSLLDIPIPAKLKEAINKLKGENDET